MKQQSARPAMKEAVVLDLGDIGAQAGRLRLAAEAKAQEIIDQAQRRAEELTQGAAERGLAQGIERGITEGVEQGMAQGHAQALADSAQRLEEIGSAFLKVATQWDAQRDQLESEGKQATLEFALRLAEKVVHRVIETDRSLVIDQVANALSHVLGPQDVTVWVNPGDVPLISEALPDLVKKLPHLEHVRLDPDPAVSLGGCRIGFGDGGVDATIEKQLERIVEFILPAVNGGPGAGAGPAMQTDNAPAEGRDEDPISS